MQGLIELQAITDEGNPGVVHREAGDVGVQRDGERVQAGVAAEDTQLEIVTSTTCVNEKCIILKWKPFNKPQKCNEKI